MYGENTTPNNNNYSVLVLGFKACEEEGEYFKK